MDTVGLTIEMRTTGTSWSAQGSEYEINDYLNTTNSVPVSVLIWSNYDVYTMGSYADNPDILFGSGSGALYPGDITTEKKTITIDPIYVGDLPTQIENGELDEEESKEKILAPLPDYIRLPLPFYIR